MSGTRTTDLHSYREVSLSLWREEHVHSLLLEGLIALRRGPHFNDVQLCGRKKRERGRRRRRNKND